MGGLFSKDQPKKPQKKSQYINRSYSSYPDYRTSEPVSNPKPQAQPVSKPLPDKIQLTVPEPSYQPVTRTTSYSRPIVETRTDYYATKQVSSYSSRAAEQKPYTYSWQQPSVGYSSTYKVEQRREPQTIPKPQLNTPKAQSTVKPPDFDPYQGCLGRWVPSSQFQGKSTSFGYFKCDSCSKTWMSARSKKQYKQACKACNKYFYPAYLWVNDSKNYVKKDKALVDTLKNHRSDLCEACRLGTCSTNVTKARQTSSYKSPEYSYEREEHYDDYYDRD